jgi:ubiquinone/menaquinone biosynthesis C-methylase UbiE
MCAAGAAPCLSDILHYWNSFANIYHKHLEHVTKQSAHTLSTILLNNLHHKSPSILEVACGPGSNAIHVAQTLADTHKSAKFTVTDYSENMIEITKQRLLALGSTPAVDLSVQREDVQNLSFSDESFDRYLANLSLHIVPDPLQMLKESYRVLKADGISGFSVWGRREESVLFTYLQQACRNAGLEYPVSTVRSQFHLGDSLIDLRNMVLGVGYRDVVCWHQYLVFDCFDMTRVADFLMVESPSNSRMLGEFSANDYARVREELLRLLENRKNAGHPIGFEVALVVAHK